MEQMFDTSSYCGFIFSLWHTVYWSSCKSAAVFVFAKVICSEISVDINNVRMWSQILSRFDCVSTWTKTCSHPELSYSEKDRSRREEGWQENIKRKWEYASRPFVAKRHRQVNFCSKQTSCSLSVGDSAMIYHYTPSSKQQRSWSEQLCPNNSP